MKTRNACRLALLGAILTVGVFTLSGCLFDEILDPPATDLPTIVSDLPIMNLGPIAYKPFVMGSGGWKELTSIDMRYRLHGCDSSGDPLWYTGTYDPDGDLLEYRIKVTGPDGQGEEIEYSVFDKNGNRVDGRWLPANYFDTHPSNANDPNSPPEYEAVVYCFTGHAGEATPEQRAVLSSKARKPPDGGTQSDPPLEELGLMRVLYWVRDPYNAIAVGYFARQLHGRTCPEWLR